VGSALKRDGVVTAPVDPERVRAFVTAARAADGLPLGGVALA